MASKTGGTPIAACARILSARLRCMYMRAGRPHVESNLRVGYVKPF
jgi:hypothetical protein